MLFIFLSIFSGIAAGWLLRSRLSFARGAERVLQPVIYALLLTMGITVGADHKVMSGLTGLGLDALVITIGALAGSMLAAKLIFVRYFSMSDNEEHDNTQTDTPDQNLTSPRPAPGNKWGSLLVILAFLSGTGIGLAITHSGTLFPGFETGAAGIDKEERLLHIANQVSHWVLYLLIFLVGVTLGNDGTILRKLRGQGFKILLIPAATIAGTLCGVAAISPLLSHMTTAECLMVGSGFGYYSLSSILITQSSGAILGTTSLAANILRELATLGFAPYMARRFGPLAPICAGGATTMDTTLPVIARVSGKNFIFVAIIHGIVVDSSVPVLVTLFSLF